MGLLISSLSTIALHNTHMASTIAQLFSGRLPLDALLVIGVDQHVSSLNDLNAAEFKTPSREQYSAMTVLASLSYCSPGADLFQRVPRNIRIGPLLNGRGQAQALLFHLDQQKTTIISFRGTQAPDLSKINLKRNLEQFVLDWAINFKANFVQFPSLLADRPKPRAHQGFQEAVNELWTAGDLDSVLNPPDPEHRFVFVGHSQGAALALMCAWRIAATRPELLDRLLAVYAIAAPLVGDQEFVQQYDAKITPLVPTFRVYNQFDPILYSQARPGYAHGPGKSKHFWRQGQAPSWWKRPEPLGGVHDTLEAVLKQSEAAGYNTIFDHFPAGPDFVIPLFWTSTFQPGYLATISRLPVVPPPPSDGASSSSQIPDACAII